MIVCRHLRLVGAFSVLVGSSAGAAAWQPPKPQTTPKVVACPEMGEGFVRIPGSGTCIRVGGSVRVEAAHIGGGAMYGPAGH